MISDMVAQLKEAGRMDLMEAALKEVPNVERDLGHPPLLTSSNQIVGVQAVMNVLSGERYKIITKAVREYVMGMGKYGKPPGPVSKELIKKVMGDKQPDYSKRAGNLADPEDWERAVNLSTPGPEGRGLFEVHPESRLSTPPLKVGLRP
jgi:2-oxoglutarate carboxylase large subunit